MARYGKEHKDVTRKRILDSAGRLFKADGVDGSGIAGLMSDAGLTNGAFYAHFASKDDLVASVIAEQMSAQAAAIRALPHGRDGLELFIREYLTPTHRDNPSAGCPSAALLDEVARSPDVTKHAYTDGANAIIDEIARRLRPQRPEAARANAIGLYTMMVGTLQLARALSDDELSQEVLTSGVANAAAFLPRDPEHH
ncbi:TetR/AcrR family transcriptional regulator [Gordonia sp. TBRC 11910]|uniref:TetR/AcrR family transcriptional regulator n=1 Tax=Gordonia asplenii TaxID=2725283 RepID=A0A848L2G9_9ACTN|nr:TetR/AcrR family transcriptional regulator [Gordonia asplenii]NMO02731.1 TetR/AcrR family transcriptional regulator [Gordonia asplenii]